MFKFISGAKKSPKDERDFLYSAVKPITVMLPERFLLDEWPVNDQGKYGSCVGQAASAQKDYHENKDTSPAFVYSFCKDRDGLKEAGTYPRTAMKVLKDLGVCLEETFPYKKLRDDVKPDLPPDNAVKQAEQYKIKSYARVSSVNEIKQAVMEDGPVMAAFIWITSMGIPEKGGFVPMPEGFLQGGHALAVTGWDDNLEHTYRQPYKNKTKYKGFFRVRNSWGKTWGDNGYCWMPYDLFTEGCDIGQYLMEAWTAVDIDPRPRPEPKPDPKPEPQPDPKEEEEMREFDVAPLIVEGRTMLEVREIAELTGAENLNWDQERQEVTIYYPDRYIVMNIGQKKYRVIQR